ncbi:MAG: hypothetical protein MJ170_04230 [Alphaproteobacteria bacterium]|nr:hypothetical protein [Alphaproteobacteria bacterium]
MKKLIIFFVCVLALNACSHSFDVEYTDMESGCLYTEKEKVRHSFLDYFGRHDSDLSVKYSGIKCETILNKEINDSVHKKPYNSINATNNTQPTLHVEVDK